VRAQDVGWQTNRLVLGKHSGRNAYRTRLKEIGLEFDSEQELNESFKRFKELADKKHEIYDEDLQALFAGSLVDSENEQFKLIAMKAITETGETPTAEVTLSVDGIEKFGNAEGDGPVDAIFKAIESVIHSDCQLQLYSVNSITGGTDSQGEVTVRILKDGHIVNGHGADTDIVAASAKAYLNAVNKAMRTVERAHPQI